MHSTKWMNNVMKTMYTSGPTKYLGLSSTMPNKTGGNVHEPAAGNSYARVAVTWTEPVDGKVYNASDIVFPTSSGAWFTASSRAGYWVLFDGASSVANVIAAGALESPIAILENTSLIIPAGMVKEELLDQGDVE